MKVLETVVRSPALVFDLHDWFAEQFQEPGRVRRPGVPARVFLSSGDGPGALSWPFRQEVELVTLKNSSGFLVFFDIIRPVNRSNESSTRVSGNPLRVSLVEGQYKGRVICEGFQEAPFTTTRDAVGRLAEVIVNLFPGATYPFPTGRRPTGLPGLTLLRGTVLDNSGQGLSNVEVSVEIIFEGATQPPVIRSSRTDEKGQWVLVLDQEDPNENIEPHVNLKFSLATGVVDVQQFGVTLGTQNSFPLTSLRGEVRRSNGTPLPGAVLQVEEAPGSTRTRADGRWAFYFPLDTPRTGSTTIHLQLNPLGGAPIRRELELHYGTMTRVAPIIV